MAQMRRRDPEPPPSPPRVEFKPGMADEMLRELAPLLAEDGIDVNNIDVPDIETLQRAMNRAVERHNMALFSPVGDTRELAVAALRLVVEALANDDTPLASAILDQVQPESPDNSAPTVSACIGITLGLLDNWLGGLDPTTPTRLADRVRLPKDTGKANAPHARSSPSPGKHERSAPSDRSSHARAAHRSSTAALSHSPRPSEPGPTTPARQCPSLLAPPSADRVATFAGIRRDSQGVSLQEAATPWTVDHPDRGGPRFSRERNTMVTVGLELAARGLDNPAA